MFSFRNGITFVPGEFCRHNAAHRFVIAWRLIGVGFNGFQNVENVLIFSKKYLFSIQKIAQVHVRGGTGFLS
jgi:hypothetical protein